MRAGDGVVHGLGTTVTTDSVVLSVRAASTPRCRAERPALPVRNPTMTVMRAPSSPRAVRSRDVLSRTGDLDVVEAGSRRGDDAVATVVEGAVVSAPEQVEDDHDGDPGPECDPGVPVQAVKDVTARDDREDRRDRIQRDLEAMCQVGL